MTRVNLVGKRFGSLVAINRAPHKGRKTAWHCQCDCGTIAIVQSDRLRTGHTKSCGCRFFMRKDDTTCRSLYGTYKSLAGKRGYEFSISYETFKELLDKPCFYCGAEPTQTLEGKKEWYPLLVYNGIDRRDNSKGYINGNVEACCKLCNRFKSALAEKVFLEHVTQITSYQNSKKAAEMSASVSITGNE